MADFLDLLASMGSLTDPYTGDPVGSDASDMTPTSPDQQGYGYGKIGGVNVRDPLYRTITGQERPARIPATKVPGAGRQGKIKGNAQGGGDLLDALSAHPLASALMLAFNPQAANLLNFIGGMQQNRLAMQQAQQDAELRRQQIERANRAQDFATTLQLNSLGARPGNAAVEQDLTSAFGAPQNPRTPITAPNGQSYYLPTQDEQRQRLLEDFRAKADADAYAAGRKIAATEQAKRANEPQITIDPDIAKMLRLGEATSVPQSQLESQIKLYNLMNPKNQITYADNKNGDRTYVFTNPVTQEMTTKTIPGIGKPMQEPVLGRIETTPDENTKRTTFVDRQGNPVRTLDLPNRKSGPQLNDKQFTTHKNNALAYWDMASKLPHGEQASEAENDKYNKIKAAGDKEWANTQDEYNRLIQSGQFEDNSQIDPNDGTKWLGVKPTLRSSAFAQPAQGGSAFAKSTQTVGGQSGGKQSIAASSLPTILERLKAKEQNPNLTLNDLRKRLADKYTIDEGK